MEKQAVIRALGALAHPLRLDIFRQLVTAGPQGCTPGQLMATLGDIPSATMSFHLKELASAGLVQPERASRHIVYRAAYEQMNGVIGYLTDNCCVGSACAPSPATPLVGATACTPAACGC